MKRNRTENFVGRALKTETEETKKRLKSAYLPRSILPNRMPIVQSTDMTMAVKPT